MVDVRRAASVIFTHRSSSILPPMNTMLQRRGRSTGSPRPALKSFRTRTRSWRRSGTFEAGVANRGFASYFSSSAGEMAFYVPNRPLRPSAPRAWPRSPPRPMKSLAPAVRQKTKRNDAGLSCLWRCHTKDTYKPGEPVSTILRKTLTICSSSILARNSDGVAPDPATIKPNTPGPKAARSLGLLSGKPRILMIPACAAPRQENLAGRAAATPSPAR